MHRDLRQRVGQAPRAAVHAAGLRIVGVGLRVDQVFRADAAIDFGDRGALAGVGDDDPAPVLCVAGGGRLHRQANAFQDHLATHRSGQVETFAYRTGSGEQFVDRSDIHPVPFTNFCVTKLPRQT